MRRVRLARARRARVQVDVDATVLDPRRVDGNRVLLEAGLAQAGLPVELPVVPRADHVVAVELALAERAADVVAHSGDGAELAVAMDEGDLGPADRELNEWRPRQLGGCTDLFPAFFGHESVPSRPSWPKSEVGDNKRPTFGGFRNDDMRDAVPRVANADEKQAEGSSSDDRQRDLGVRAQQDGAGYEPGVADTRRDRVPQPVLPDRLVGFLAAGATHDDRPIDQPGEAGHSKTHRKNSGMSATARS